MKITFWDDDLCCICAQELPAVPAVGDTVVLYGTTCTVVDNDLAAALDKYVPWVDKTKHPHPVEVAGFGPAHAPTVPLAG